MRCYYSSSKLRSTEALLHLWNMQYVFHLFVSFTIRYFFFLLLIIERNSSLLFLALFLRSDNKLTTCVIRSLPFDKLFWQNLVLLEFYPDYFQMFLGRLCDILMKCSEAINVFSRLKFFKKKKKNLKNQDFLLLCTP